MRISDWSSDVCSSDLHAEHGAHEELARARQPEPCDRPELRHQQRRQRSGYLVMERRLQRPRRPPCVAQIVERPLQVKKIELIVRSEEHTSELQSLKRSSYAVLCMKKNT